MYKEGGKHGAAVAGIGGCGDVDGSRLAVVGLDTPQGVGCHLNAYIYMGVKVVGAPSENVFYILKKYLTTHGFAQSTVSIFHSYI